MRHAPSAWRPEHSSVSCLWHAAPASAPTRPNSSFLEVSGQKSGGKFQLMLDEVQRGARTVDGACAIGPRWTSCRNQCFQAVPEIRCWHQKMTSWKEIILTLFSLGCFSARWGVLRLMQCLARAIRVAFYKGLAGGKAQGQQDPPSSISPSIPLQGEKGGWDGAHCWQPGEHPAAAHAISIPRNSRETGWLLWAHLDTESCFELWSQTGNITADLGDHSCHCSCNRGW